MAMAVSAVRFEPEEKEWISSFAKLNGNTFSAQVRQWTLERLEDEMDAYDLKKAIAESRRDATDVGITIDEFIERYGE